MHIGGEGNAQLGVVVRGVFQQCGHIVGSRICQVWGHAKSGGVSGEKHLQGIQQVSDILRRVLFVTQPASERGADRAEYLVHATAVWGCRCGSGTNGRVA